MDKKVYCYFNIVDRLHVKDSRYLCVYGTHHEIVKYQWIKMAELAKEWDRRFNPIEEFYPYDWNGNQVYCVCIGWWSEDEKRPSPDHGYRFEDISTCVA